MIRLDLLDVRQEFFEPGHASAGFGVENVAIKAIVLRNFHQLVRSGEMAVLVLLHHFADKLVAVGAVTPRQKDGTGNGHAVSVAGVNQLGRGNGNGALAGGAAPEVVDVYILVVVEGVDEVAVASLRGRLAGAGIAHGQGHNLGVTGSQGVHIGTHPAFLQLDGAPVIAGVRVIVGAPVLQLVDLETSAIGLQGLILVIVLVGNFQGFRPVAQRGSGGRYRLGNAGNGAEQHGSCTY